MAKKPAKPKPAADASKDAELTDVRDVVEDAELVSENTPESEAPHDEVSKTDTIPPENVITAPVERSGNRALPLVLGGVVAAGLGYAAAYFTQDHNDYAARIAEQQSTIASLESRLDALPDATAIVEAAKDESLSAVDALANRLNGSLTEMTARIDAIEMQPNADGSSGQAAIAAYQRDLDALRAEITNQQGEAQGLAATAMAELEQAREQANAIEQSAANAARNAIARAAFARVQVALESGAPAAEALGELAGAMEAPLPAELDIVAEGVPTLAALQSTFPEAARVALATARSEGADGEQTGGFTAFLRNQLDIRSVTPRDGDSVDAILSRAEASLRAGHLNDTVAEIAALPEVARGAMSEWVGSAQTRLSALAAAQTISDSLNAN